MLLIVLFTAVMTLVGLKIIQNDHHKASLVRQEIRQEDESRY